MPDDTATSNETVRDLRKEDGSIDWREVRRRLAKTQEALHTGEVLSAAQVQQILAQRARRTAAALSDEPKAGETMQVLTFSLANERYGLEACHVEEVQPLRQFSVVPCTPEFVLGVVNIRGNIYPVIDIRKFFGVPSAEFTDQTRVILVNVAGLEVGILADSVFDVVDIRLSDIEPPLATLAGVRQEYIQGVTQEMLAILDMERLMQDERMIIHEEVT